jgi:predicted HTH domain antitoxin
MQVAIQLPDDFAHRLQARWGNLSQRTLEAIAVEAYREAVLTAAEVGNLLGHTSRWQTEQFLHDKQAYLHYDEADLDHDTAELESLIQR